MGLKACVTTLGSSLPTLTMSNGHYSCFLFFLHSVSWAFSDLVYTDCSPGSFMEDKARVTTPTPPHTTVET